MAIFKVLGSCSGTEPMAGRHHTSLVLSSGDRNYIFDAGENCSHTAHTQGVDLCSTRAIFISHPHYDHIGGLMGLFWTLNKLNNHCKIPIADGEVKLFIPEISVWENIYGVLKRTEGGFNHKFGITVDNPKLGVFYEDENIRVTAFESHHLPQNEDGSIRSFSYKIETEGKVAVFSGDVKGMEDIEAAVGDGCDLLLCETGHHKVKTVCDFAEAHNVKQLVFVHHGREILDGKPTVKEALDNCKIPVIISDDGTAIEI